MFVQNVHRERSAVILPLVILVQLVLFLKKLVPLQMQLAHLVKLEVMHPSLQHRFAHLVILDITLKHLVQQHVLLVQQLSLIHI